MKRNGSRNKFLTCFRPGFQLEEMILDDGMKRTGSSNKFIRFFRPSFHLEQMISDDHSVSDYSASYGRRSSEKWGSDEAEFYPRLSKRKTFSRAIKSIFHSPRSKDRNSRNQVSDSPTRVPSLTWTESTDEEDYDSITEEFGTSSSSTSSGSGSASSGSGSDSETPSTEETTRKPDPVPERKKYGILAMILLLLVSVAVTVLGGKLLGVALTLICVYLVPRRWGIVGGVVSGKGGERRSSETECRKQRMGGMMRMMSHRRLNLESLIRFREIQEEM
ncbi:hypothetical protein LINPERHAP1_LOCUS16305 [Linum perenne]